MPTGATSSSLHAMPLVVAALCVLALAYRYYSAFIAARVLVLDDARVTPAHRLNDGHNYHPTHKWVLFGHHFAAISGAGPLIGPVLAAQFGWAPSYVWLLVGVVIGGAVQDFVVLAASMRRDGRSLAELARQELGTFGGLVTGVAILFIVVIALAGLGAAVRNALAESAWGAFTIACTIPIALLMAAYMYKLRPGAVVEASAIGVALLLAAVWCGQYAQTAAWGRWFLLTRDQIVYAMAAYGFVASVLPVWLLLCPRDYLSAFMKIGTIALLVAGVIVVNPPMRIPAVSEFARAGNGPVIPGSVFPMVFITVMCGAVSGFHSLVSSGTTPKMIARESHARPIGYGCMLIESLVGVIALVAVSGLEPDDYFLINTPPARAAQYDFHAVDLPDLEHAVGEPLVGRTGGAPTLAVGMAKIFSKLPLLSGPRVTAIWYHFAIMFEALFILTTIDTGTRIARFLLQEFIARLTFLGPVATRFHNPGWWPGVFVSTTLIVAAWAGFLKSGGIDTIWPMFGIANQMLAAIALAVMTTLLLRAGRGRQAWITAVPMAWVLVTTTAGGVTQIRRVFWPMATRAGAAPAEVLKGWLNLALVAVMIGCAGLIVARCVARWREAWRTRPPRRVPAAMDERAAA
ncbi:MAG: carbon starvation protein A [Phycisphaerae bacterium]